MSNSNEEQQPTTVASIVEEVPVIVSATSVATNTNTHQNVPVESALACGFFNIGFMMIFFGVLCLPVQYYELGFKSLCYGLIFGGTGLCIALCEVLNKQRTV